MHVGQRDADSHRVRVTCYDRDRVYFGNVAQDRWVWGVDFTHDFLDPGAQVMLYIDADYEAETGRPLGEGGADVLVIARCASYVGR